MSLEPPSRSRNGSIARRLTWLATVALPIAVLSVGADDAQPPLRVGTSGDYAPFSRALEEGEPNYEGLDIALARAYAADRDRPIEFVHFRWQRLLTGLEADRFDVAMSGITVRPDRSVAGRFTRPVAETGAVVLVPDGRDPDDFDALNKPKIRIGVNAGGYLEPVARKQFAKATLVSIPDNASILNALEDGHLDALVVDSVEADTWTQKESPLVRSESFTRDRKAFLVRADAEALALDLDRWLLEKQRDGTLARFQIEYLGPGADTGGAAPLPALIAAIDERLSLMPPLGALKRDSGIALEVPERDAADLDAATALVLEFARAREDGAPPPASDAIRKFFEILLQAEREIQWKAVKDLYREIDTDQMDLDALLASLDRIERRFAPLILELSDTLERSVVRSAVEDGLRAERVSSARRRALSNAIAGLRSKRIPPGSRTTPRPAEDQ